MSLESEDLELIASLQGRTILSAVWKDASPDADWTEHEYALLTLDDGRTIRFGSYGYDAWGATVEDATPCVTHDYQQDGGRGAFCSRCGKYLDGSESPEYRAEMDAMSARWTERLNTSESKPTTQTYTFTYTPGATPEQSSVVVSVDPTTP